MTGTLFLIAGTLILYLFFYYAFGALTVRLFPASDFSFARTTFLGFFVYHFLFTVIALPMKVLLWSLSLLSAVWAAVLLTVTIAFFVLERRSFRSRLARLRTLFEGRQKYISLAFLLLIALQLIRFNLNDETYAIWDQSYYLGDTATSLYTNTISQYNPYTGKILEHLNSEYLLETYQNHSAVMCQLLHLHPMVEVLTVMASVVIILYQLILYEIGRFLFRGNRAKAVVMLAFLFLLNYFSYNLFTAAEFLIIRPSEGKTILAVLILPALLYCFLKTIPRPEDLTYWRYSFLIILGSFGLNMSAIFMIPFEISAFYIPLAIRKKSLRIFVRYLILLIPCAVMSALYLLTKEKFLIYTGK